MGNPPAALAGRLALVLLGVVLTLALPAVWPPRLGMALAGLVLLLAAVSSPRMQGTTRKATPRRASSRRR